MAILETLQFIIISPNRQANIHTRHSHITDQPRRVEAAPPSLQGVTSTINFHLLTFHKTDFVTFWPLLHCKHCFDCTRYGAAGRGSHVSASTCYANIFTNLNVSKISQTIKTFISIFCISFSISFISFRFYAHVL